MQAPHTRPGGGAPSRARDRAAVLHALAWSVSRHRLLAACERAVFWQYFGARGLGLPAGDPAARRAFALKHLTALPLLVGTAVHAAARELIAARLDGVPQPAYEDLLAGARLTLNHAWRSSRPDQIDRFWQMPTVFPALQEVVYRGRLRPEEIERARGRLITCLDHLYEAPVLEDLEQAGREGIRLGFGPPELFAVPAACAAPAAPATPTPTPCTDHDTHTETAGPAVPGDPVTLAAPVAPPVAGGAAGSDTRAPRLVAWAALDVAYLHPGLGSVPAWQRSRAADRLSTEAREAAPTWCVVDFKTGRANPDAERLQLGAYGLWLEAAGLPRAGGIYLGRIVDLLEPADRWYRIGEPELAAARAVIAADVARQEALMLDPVQGLPKPKVEWALAADRRICPRCRFHALCKEELRPVHERVAERRRGVEP